MIDSPLSTIRSVLPALEGVRILDAGSGEGELAGLLAGEGAEIVGIDPNPEAVARARVHAPACMFDLGAAENLPYADASFDLVIFSNALHHVPVGRMEAAIDEASRVLRPNGFLIVIEPIAGGSAFEALRTVEDETVVRLAAQEALKSAALKGQLALIRTVSYIRRETYKNAEVILDRMIAVDPMRESAIRSRRTEVIKAIRATAECSPNGDLVLKQPIKADIMRKADAWEVKPAAS